MTNLLAVAVTLLGVQSSEVKTNTVQHSADPRNPYVLYISAPRDEKWITTTVERQHTLTFDWLGRRFTNSCTEVLSSNLTHLRIKQEWEEVPLTPTTPAIHVDDFTVTTNTPAAQ